LTPQESRLLALERKQARIGDLIRGLTIDSRRAGQALWDHKAELLAPPVAVGPPTIQIGLKGCNVLAIPSGYPIALNDHATGSPITSGTVSPAGVFSSTVSLAGIASVDLVMARFLTHTAAVAGGSITGTFTFNPDATHACFSSCAVPVGLNLTLVAGVAACNGVVWPNDTLVHAAGTGRWIGTAALPGIYAGYHYNLISSGQGVLTANFAGTDSTLTNFAGGTTVCPDGTHTFSLTDTCRVVVGQSGWAGTIHE
jgi:hypothetical protein